MNLLNHVITSGAVLFVATFATMASAADHPVVQKDKAFSESEISAKVGDTVTFDNQDTITHNLYSKDAGNEFEFTKQDPGKKEVLTLKSPGIVKVHCAIHPKMKMVINVQ